MYKVYSVAYRAVFSGKDKARRIRREGWEEGV